MDEVFERSYNYCRKNGTNTLESKRNYRIMETSPFHRKGCFVSIFLCNPNLMVTRKPISKWIYLLSFNVLYYFICKRVGHGSWRNTSFNFLRSMQIWISPILFSCNTIGIIDLDSSTCSIIPAYNILSNSFLSFSLYLGLNLYGRCLIVLH